MAVKVERSAAAGAFAESEWAEGGVERETGRWSTGAGGTESRGRCNTEDDEDEVNSAKEGSVRTGEWLGSSCGCLRVCHSLPIMAGRAGVDIWEILAVSGGDMRQRRERWVAQERTVSRERRKGLAFQQIQLRSRHRRRMNRLEAPVLRGLNAGLPLAHAGCGGSGNALLHCESSRRPAIITCSGGRIPATHVQQQGPLARREARHGWVGHANGLGGCGKRSAESFHLCTGKSSRITAAADSTSRGRAGTRAGGQQGQGEDACLERAVGPPDATVSIGLPKDMSSVPGAASCIT
jgi:hypothetical protein